jgi:MFS family permease
MMQSSDIDPKILTLLANLAEDQQFSDNLHPDGYPAHLVPSHLHQIQGDSPLGAEDSAPVHQNSSIHDDAVELNSTYIENIENIEKNGQDPKQADLPAVTPEIEPIELSGSGSEETGSTDDLVPKQGFLAVLHNPNFLALWGGQVFCQLADKVYLVMMIALINTQFQASNQSISGWVSALMMAFTIPAILFGSVAGVFIDRWPKKTVLVATNVLRGILVLAIPLLLWLTHGWKPIGVLPVGFLMILGITFLVSTLTQFFAPAEQAVIPLVVEEQHLLSANSLYTTTMMASLIVGFAVGEPLLALSDQIWLNLVGTGNGMGKEIIVGSSYAIAGLILFLLKTKEVSHPPETEFPNIFADLKDSLRYLNDNHRIRNAVLQLVILFSVFAALTVLAVRMAEIIPHLKASQFGFLLAFGGIGIALGAGILGQFGQRFSYSLLSFCGCLGMAASLVGLSVFSTNLWIVLMLITSLGIFGALVGIPMQTTIQTETPADMRGKVFGLQNNVINIALSLPLALTGVAETFIGLKAVFLSLAIAVFFGGILTRCNYRE